MAKKQHYAEQPLLHPLVGKRVVCEVQQDDNVGRKGGICAGVLRSIDSTVLQIGNLWYFRSSVTGLRAA